MRRPISFNMRHFNNRLARGFCIRRAFTLLELMMIIVILAVLAAIVVPQIAGASDVANDSSVRRDLQILRHQIQFFRTRNSADPDFAANGWDDLVVGDYIHHPPVNPLNGNVTVAAAPADGVGWVWRDAGLGTFNLYATDQTSLAEFVE